MSGAAGRPAEVLREGSGIRVDGATGDGLTISTLGCRESTLAKDFPGLICHQRAQSNDFSLMAATRTIFLTLRDKSAIWLQAVSDVNTAESRIQELASFWPGEFWVMDQQSHQIVARVNGLLSQRLRGYDKSNA
jgi:hypothetical protein